MADPLYATLTQVIGAYDIVSQRNSVDRNSAIKQVFESYLPNPIVAAVMQGKTNFVDELIKYAKGDTTKKRELKTAIGYGLPDVSINGLEIVGFAGLGELIGLHGSSDDMSRRDILRAGAGLLTGAALGTGVAEVKKEMSLAWLVDYFERAQFLDNTYRSLT